MQTFGVRRGKGVGRQAAARDLGGRPCGPTYRPGALRVARRPLSSARPARCARRRRVSSRSAHCVRAAPRTAPGRRLPRALRPACPRLCSHALAMRRTPRRCRRVAWGAGAAGRGRRRGSQGWGRRAQRASTTDSPASCAAREARGAKWTARPQAENRSEVGPQGQPPRSDRRARTPSRSGAPMPACRLSANKANSRNGPQADLHSTTAFHASRVARSAVESLR